MARQLISGSRAALICGTALFIPASFTPAFAQDSRGGIDVSVGGEVAGNPYLYGSGNDVSVAGTVEVRPWYKSEGETTTFDLEGFARGRAFVSDYGFEDSYGASTKVTSRVSETAKVYGRAAVYSSESRVLRPFGGFSPIVGPIEDPLPPFDPTFGDDITLLGVSGRTTTISTDVGGDVALSERTSLNGNVGYQKLIVDDVSGADYDAVTGDLGLNHRLSEQTSVGVTGGVRKTYYKDPAFGDATSYIGLASVQHRLSPEWTAKVSGGVAITDTKPTALVPGRERTSFVTEGSLCNAQEERLVCFNFSRMPQPTSQGGVRTRDGVGFTVADRLSEKTHYSFGANYSRVSGDNSAAGLFPKLEYLTSYGSLERTITNRLSAFAYGSVSRVYGDTLSTSPSFNIGAGLKFRFGALR